MTATYAYDATGNTTGRPNGTDTQSLTWSPEGQLGTLTEKSASGTTKSTTSHVYDADGTLLIRRNTGGETVLHLDDGTEVHLDTSTSTAKYWAQRYYNVGGQVIALRTDKTGTETLSWLASDQHGTSSLALDATSQAVTKRYSTPFGAARTGGTGSWPDDKAFLGKSADSSTSLTYVGAREYDAATGRFLSVDPELDTSDTQSLNGYTYADNSPVTQSDPTGLESCGPVHFCSGNNGTYGTYHPEQDPGSKKYKGSSNYCATHKCGGGGGTGRAPASDPVTIAPIPPRQFDEEAKRAWLDALHMVDKQNRMTDANDIWDARNGIHLASETFWEVFCDEAPGACPKSRPDAHNSTDFGYFPMTSSDSSGGSLKDVLRGGPSAAAAGIWYRNLRPDEDPAEGLFAKNVDGDYTINVQIGQGSRVRTQWISVTKSWDVIKKWRQPGQRVAIIDGDKVEARLVDLTSAENRARYLRGWSANTNAQSSQEALVERYINPSAIIGLVEDEE
ncbi:RHS repeat-associated core domain-containing protein [Streptomyces griseorubiginosus]|uniref:RHS repeat-associated core domain-containing protein n=1 Tax=Streptomyces griseorubiginosus TaxID=67304 RepID=UPI0027E282AA|nr:RHS repeat-associated core domain-containing protein [Streptomyces griseorubiginosus]